jgi:hypothetical protein
MSGAIAVAEDGVRLTDEQKRRRRARSIALAVVLGMVVVIFYVLTIVRLGSNAAGIPVPQ